MELRCLNKVTVGVMDSN